MEEVVSLGDGVIFRVSDTRDNILNEYDSILSEEPIAISEFNIHMKDRMLVYSRESCDDSNLDPPFFLYVTPVDSKALHAAKRPYGFDDLDFDFRNSKRYDHGRCASSVLLPEYSIAAIRTGQYDENGTIWSIYLVNGRDFLLSEPFGFITRGEPSVEVYRADRLLVYVRESCETPDLIPRFFLHIVPRDRKDLPDERRSHGFENWNFNFQDRGSLASNRCIWSITLPEYPIACIRTGQFLRSEEGYLELWSMEFFYREGRPTEEFRPCP